MRRSSPPTKPINDRQPSPWSGDENVCGLNCGTSSTAVVHHHHRRRHGWKWEQKKIVMVLHEPEVCVDGPTMEIRFRGARGGHPLMARKWIRSKINGMEMRFCRLGHAKVCFKIVNIGLTQHFDNKKFLIFWNTNLSDNCASSLCYRHNQYAKNTD